MGSSYAHPDFDSSGLMSMTYIEVPAGAAIAHAHILCYSLDGGGKRVDQDGGGLRSKRATGPNLRATPSSQTI